MVRVAVITAVVVLIALPLTAQNLLVNPGFDEADQLDDWTCTTTYGVTSWSTEDHLESTASGSMQIDLSETSINRLVTCSQCVPVTELNSYAASAWLNWPDDADVTQDGSSRLSFGFFSDAGCTTAVEWCPIAFAHYPGNQLGAWILLPTLESVAPVGAVAARIVITTWQDLANEPVRAHIDDVDFRTTTIFRDGFESGTTNAWEP